MADDALVIFTPSGRRGRFEAGTTVLDAARSLGVDIDSVCGGRGICGRCQVTQGLGEFPKHGIVSEPGNLSPFAALEATYRDEKGLAADRRLSCTAEVCGDVLIDVPPESQVHRQVVRKGLDVRDFTSTRSSGSTTSRSRRPSSPRRPATSPACSRRSSASGS